MRADTRRPATAKGHLGPYSDCQAFKRPRFGGVVPSKYRGGIIAGEAIPVHRVRLSFCYAGMFPVQTVGTSASLVV